MWQQDPFQVDRRLVNDSEPLKTAKLVQSAVSSKLHTSSCSSTATGFCCWHREATLVQSPVSVNSEASVTSTPDQCPASPAASLCEMPSSRNGGNNLMANTSNQHQQHISGQWKNLPSGALTPASESSMLGLDCTSWSTNSSGVSQAASSAANASFDPSGDTAPPYDSNQGGWSSILTESKGCTGSGYEFGGLNEALVCTNGQDVVGVAQAAYCVGSSARASAPMACNSVSMTESRQPGLSPFGTLFVSDARSRRIKQEEEQYPAGPNPMVIDEKMFRLQNSAAQDNSKIGNFIDLLRQSDSPVSDATTAASCNHLSQLLTSQEASGMWIARSSRLPAMLSEVLPPSSGCKTEGRNSRTLQESMTPSADVVERAHTGQPSESSTSRLKQDRDEPLSDRPACLGVAANDDLTSELFSKRPRIENSSSFPFKVRKEKLGERISALQQLVSPFGKTDTASVLLEAIGYIKFLHEQVQVLSSPYMKHTSTTTRNNEHGKFCWTSAGKEAEEAKQDLRSRGLCLVPISCTLQVANDNGADYWTPTLHGGLK